MGLSCTNFFHTCDTLAWHAYPWCKICTMCWFGSNVYCVPLYHIWYSNGFDLSSLLAAVNMTCSLLHWTHSTAHPVEYVKFSLVLLWSNCLWFSAHSEPFFFCGLLCRFGCSWIPVAPCTAGTCCSTTGENVIKFCCFLIYLCPCLFGKLLKYFDSVPLCYLDFAFVVCADCEYSPSGPAILENVLQTHMVLLAQKWPSLFFSLLYSLYYFFLTFFHEFWECSEPSLLFPCLVGVSTGSGNDNAFCKGLKTPFAVPLKGSSGSLLECLSSSNCFHYSVCFLHVSSFVQTEMSTLGHIFWSRETRG